MNLALVVYLIQLADRLAGFSFYLMWAIAAIMVVTLGVSVICQDPEVGVDKSFSECLNAAKFKLQVSLFFILLFLSAALPNKETSYTMLAAYGVDLIIENDKVQAIAGKSLDVLERQLDAYLKTDTSVIEKE